MSREGRFYRDSAQHEQCTRAGTTGASDLGGRYDPRMLVVVASAPPTAEVAAARRAYDALTRAYNNLVDDEPGEPPFAPRLTRARTAAAQAVELLAPYAARPLAASAAEHARAGIALLDTLLVSPEPSRPVVTPVVNEAMHRFDQGLDALLGYDLFG